MKGKRHIAKAILLIICALFTGVALASYDPGDWGEFMKAANMCGPLGALIAGILRLGFGPFFSWFLPLFLLYWGLLSLRARSLRSETRRLVISAILFIIVMSLAAFAAGDGYGGAIGQKMADYLEVILGRIGSILVLAGAGVLLALFLFFGSIKALLGRLSGISLPAPRLPRRAAAKPAAVPRPRKQPVRNERETVQEEPERQPVRIAVPERKSPKPKSKAQVKKPVLPATPVTGAENAPLPDISILGDYSAADVSFSKEDLIARSEVIEEKLKDYGLEGKVQEVRPGPVVTTFEFVPAPGVKVSQIASRADDISLALAARAIRILAPIPGKGAVGIEVPNPEPQIVTLREMMEHYPADSSGLTFAVGKTVTGEPFFADLAEMPHLLIAGATGSGKSVCINSIICSLLVHHTPATCRFILVDPKRLELITYNGIPHLLHPVITEPKQALKVLQWLTLEMERRYKLLASIGVKNIAGFNRKVLSEKITESETGERLAILPYYIAIIDELADIMVMMGNEIYPPLTRLSQMARAVGIHLVFATQRPSVDVVTGLIKANFPCRIAFQVTSKIDSRTILDVNGGETLLGNGDMLYLPKNLPAPIRMQGAFISESDAEKVAGYWRAFMGGGDEIDLSEQVASESDEEQEIDDDLFNKARELVIIHQQGSISLLQRRLRVGYARAARLIDMLEQSGVVGPFEGSKARRVLVSREEYERS
jgi:S-DNA-T family DNA segregation ATPase FtsK/SpoIIIE